MQQGSGGPGDEELLVALANTGHDGPDELADPAALAAWWAEIHGPVVDPSSSGAGSDALRGLRRSVQEAALRHNGGAAAPGDADPDDAWTSVAGLALRPQLSDGRVSLVPQRAGDLASDVAAVALVALLRATARPTWSRVKACRGTDCGWVFLDTSRNGSRRWCDMATCGNRAKTTAFRARHRPPRSASQQAVEERRG